MATAPAYRYKAFLSYSRRDSAIATSLRHGLHSFNRPWYALWSVRVFQDTADGTVQSSLGTLIRTALDQSEYLIVVVSKASAQSEWVGREIAHWIDSKRPLDKLLLVVADGSIGWDEANGDFGWSATDCLPGALKGQFKDVPTWLDLRPFERKAVTLRDPAFLDAVATLSSSLTGKDKATLTGEDRRKQKTRLALATAAIAGLAFLAVVAIWFAVLQRRAAAEARAQQRIAEAETRRAVGERLAAQSTNYLRRRPDVGVLLAIEAARRTSLDGPTRIAAVEQALLDALSTTGGTPLGEVAVVAGRGLAFATESPALALLRTDGVDVLDLASDDPSATKTPLRLPDMKFTSVAISADGRTVAAGTDNEKLEGVSGPVLWKKGDGGWSSRVLPGWTRHNWNIALSTDGRWAVTGGVDGGIAVYDLASPEPSPRKFPAHDRFVDVASLGGSRFLTIGYDRGVAWWDAGSDPPASVVLRPPARGSSDHRPVALSPNRRWAAVSNGKIVDVWQTDASPPQRVRQIAMEGDAVAIDDDARHVVSSRHNGGVDVWTEAGVTQLLCSRHGNVYAAIAPDGRWLTATARVEDDIRICAWNLGAADPAGIETILRADDGDQLAPYFSTDGHWLVTVNRQKARLWSAARGFADLASRQLTSYTGEGTHMLVTPDERHLIVAKPDGADMYDADAPEIVPMASLPVEGVLLAVKSDLQQWISVESEQVLLRGSGSPYDVHVLMEKGVGTVAAFSRTGRYAAVLHADNAILFDTTDNSSTPIQAGNSSYPVIAFSHDERWLLTNTVLTRLSGTPGHYPLSHPPSGARLGSGSLRTAAFSPDGRYLVTGFGNTAWRWSLDTPATPPVPLVRTTDNLRVVRYSPDGRMVVAGSYDSSVHLVRFDGRGRFATTRLPVSEHFVIAAAFSRDSRWLAVGSVDGHAYLWDTASEARSMVPVRFDGGGLFVDGVHFGGPKGERLFVQFNISSAGVSVRAFERSLPVLERLAEKTVSRNLTRDEWQQFLPSESYRKTFARLP